MLKKKKIKILTFEDSYQIACKSNVLGISVRYHKIFKPAFFSAFSPGIINLHGGELPRYRGSNIANYAILENAKRGGGTLHFISPGIDEGDIVEREFFDVLPTDTAFSFFKKTLESLQVAFLRFIKSLETSENNEIKKYSQESFIQKGETTKTYYRKDLETHRYVDLKNKSVDFDDISRLTRAFHFPGHNQSVYLKYESETIELKYL